MEVEGDNRPGQQRRGEPGDAGPRRETRCRVQGAPAAAPLDALGDPGPHDDDARHGEEAESEGDLPHHAGVERRQHQRGEHQGGETVALASEIERRQIEGGHDRGPLRRRRQSGEHRVAPHGEQGERKEEPAGPRGEPPRQRQRHHQRHADVQAGDGEEVRRAGVAEVTNDVRRDVRADADGQGLGQGGLRLGKRARQRAGDLAAGGEQGSVEPRPLARSAQFYPRERHHRADALLGEVAREVEIAGAPRRFDLAGKPEGVALMEEGVFAGGGQRGGRTRRHQHAALRLPPIVAAPRLLHAQLEAQRRPGTFGVGVDVAAKLDRRPMQPGEAAQGRRRRRAGRSAARRSAPQPPPAPPAATGGAARRRLAKSSPASSAPAAPIASAAGRPSSAPR